MTVRSISDLNVYAGSNKISRIYVGATLVFNSVTGVIDNTAPTIDNFIVGAQDSSGISITIDVTESSSLPITTYIVAVTTGESAPSVPQISGGFGADSLAAEFSTSYTIDSDDIRTINDSGALTTGTYDFYCAIEDNANNFSNRAVDSSVSVS